MKRSSEICRLCGNNKLLCKSHIIPEAFYKPVYDKHNHLFLRYNAENKGMKSKCVRKGLWEYLLCKECEKKLNDNYEDYAKKVWNGYDKGEHSKIKFIPRPHGLETTGLNYCRMKLFFLSVLWRAGISTLPDFGSVILGPHEKKIRKMIYEGNPGRYFEYGTLLFANRKDKEIKHITGHSIFILPPIRTKDNHRVYRFCIGSIFWYIFVSSHLKNSLWCKGFLQEDGAMFVYQWDDYAEKIMKDIGNKLTDEQ